MVKHTIYKRAPADPPQPPKKREQPNRVDLECGVMYHDMQCVQCLADNVTTQARPEDNNPHRQLCCLCWELQTMLHCRRKFDMLSERNRDLLWFTMRAASLQCDLLIEHEFEETWKRCYSDSEPWRTQR